MALVVVAVRLVVVVGLEQALCLWTRECIHTIAVTCAHSCIGRGCRCCMCVGARLPLLPLLRPGLQGDAG